MNVLMRDGNVLMRDGEVPSEDCECCGECVLFWKAESCPIPSNIPGNCAPIDPFTFVIWVRVGARCDDLDGEVIGPGDVIVVDGLCYIILDELRHRLNFPGEACSDQYDAIPLGSRVIDDLIVTCQPEGCNAQPCIAARVGYAQAVPCGPSQITYYFCKALLFHDCVYKALPTGIPGESGTCFAFKASAPSLSFIPPEEFIVDPNPTGPDSLYRSCCECNRGGLVEEPCNFSITDSDGFGNPIVPPIECCCGTDEQAAQSVATIEQYTYEQIAPGQRILVELVGSPSGPVGVVIPATLRQRVYLNDVLFSDVEFPGDFTIPMCGPQPVPILGGDFESFTIVDSEIDCNGASAVFERGNPNSLYERYTWAYSKTAPDVAAPCLGGCAGTSPRPNQPLAFRAL